MSDEHWIEVRERDFVNFSQALRFMIITPEEYLKFHQIARMTYPILVGEQKNSLPLTTSRGEVHSILVLYFLEAKPRYIFMTEKEASAIRDKLPHPSIAKRSQL